MRTVSFRHNATGTIVLVSLPPPQNKKTCAQLPISLIPKFTKSLSKCHRPDHLKFPPLTVMSGTSSPFALAELPNAIFKASSALSGHTLVHGTVRVGSRSPRSIEFDHANGTDCFASSLSSSAGFQILVQSNFSYYVRIGFNDGLAVCNATPGIIVPSGSDYAQDFRC